VEKPHFLSMGVHFNLVGNSFQMRIRSGVWQRQGSGPAAAKHQKHLSTNADDHFAHFREMHHSMGTCLTFDLVKDENMHVSVC
jgi:hypothetical protein